MKLYVNWRSSLGSIFKNKKRSFLTMFGIIIGIAAVIAILSIGNAYERQMISALSAGDSDRLEVNLQFRPDDWNLYNSNLDLIPRTDFAALEEIPGVESIEYPTTDYTSDMSYFYQTLSVRGKTKDYTLGIKDAEGTEAVVGRALTAYDSETLEKVVTIDEGLAEELYGSSEEALGRGLTMSDNGVMTIVGIFPRVQGETMFSMGDPAIEIPLETYKQVFGEAEDTSSITLVLASGAQMNKVADEAIKTLEDEGMMRELGTYSVSDMAMMTDEISNMMSTITVFISSVAGISLFIAGVGVMNMMYISVSERTKEIGIRRALGATRGAIRTQFLLEGMTLTLVGGIIGYIVGMILAYALGSTMDLEVSIDLFTVILAVGVSSGIGLVFSVMPASEAARKDLIDILR
ncbi:ABC transporter permease [Enterococcus sp. AZ109]|uniref:ABC transporter permease n=1 Tax=Enterococcus sp. AZ109 TaxID=2774634 RepID=UPI003F27CE18